MAKSLTLTGEHAHAIAAAVANYIAAQDVRYADRATACEKSYNEMVDRIEAALSFAIIARVNG